MPAASFRRPIVTAARDTPSARATSAFVIPPSSISAQRLHRSTPPSRSRLSRRGTSLGYRVRRTQVPPTDKPGDAIGLLAETPGEFDVVFIDIDKGSYPAALEAAVARLRPGGLLIADNVLWGGRVAQEAGDADTEALQEFVRRLHADPRLLAGIIPVEDGMGVAMTVA